MIPFFGKKGVTSKQLAFLKKYVLDPNYQIIPIQRIRIVRLNLGKRVDALYNISLHRMLYSQQEYQMLLNKLASNEKSKHNAMLAIKDIQKGANLYLNEIFESIYQFANHNQITIQDSAYIHGLNESYIQDDSIYERVMGYLDAYIKTQHNIDSTKIPGTEANTLIQINKNRFKSHRTYLIYFHESGFRRSDVIKEKIINTMNMPDQNIQEE